MEIDKVNKILLSIIVPIYNVEAYIEKCLQSIYSQIDELPVEIVLINDGSSDKSMEKAQLFIDKKTIVINQHNQGLSIARNNGIHIAHGEYIWFVDSDDWLTDKAIQNIINNIQTYKAQLFIYKLKTYYEESRIFGEWPPFSKNTHNTQGPPLSLLGKETQITPIQMYVIKKSLIVKNNLFFKNNIFHEDYELIPKLLYFTNECIIINYTSYNYRIRKSGSITTSYKTKRITDCIDTIKELHSFMEKNVMSDLCERNFSAIIHKLTLTTFVYASCKHKDVTTEKYIRKNSKILQKASLLKLKKKYKLSIADLIILISPTICLRLLKWKRN